MFEIDIPRFGPVRLEHLVSDFTGTLSVDGELLPGVKERLNTIAGFMTIHVLTADTFGTARQALEGVNCEIHILDSDKLDTAKADFIRKLGAEKVAAFGNGNNDRKMLKLARIGIAVTEREGCSADAILSADIHVTRSVDGLDLLLNPLRCKATLRS